MVSGVGPRFPHWARPRAFGLSEVLVDLADAVANGVGLVLEPKGLADPFNLARVVLAQPQPEVFPRMSLGPGPASTSLLRRHWFTVGRRLFLRNGNRKIPVFSYLLNAPFCRTGKYCR